MHRLPGRQVHNRFIAIPGSSKLLSLVDERLNQFQPLIREALFGLAVEQARSESEGAAAVKPSGRLGLQLDRCLISACSVPRLNGRRAEASLSSYKHCLSL